MSWKIGFGKVIKLVGVANGDGGGELASAKAIKEGERGHVAADGAGLESGQGA